jgi:mannosyl-3-phosphoglycerate phosphatase
MSASLLIFTDLDGTLLDAKSYSFQAALPALERIRTLEVPLIIVSSKTRAEIEVYRHRLLNGHPFISENGGGVFIPKGYFPAAAESDVESGYVVMRLGTPYEATRGKFMELRERTGVAVRGFGDMVPDEVSALTGLPVEEAALAKQRDFSEPFVFAGDPDAEFLRSIEAVGMRWTQGRLFHIMGEHDKGQAVQIVRDLFIRKNGPVRTVGLGDGLNDLPFLQAVDQAVVVKRDDGTHDARIQVPGMLLSDGIGPAGWNEEVLRLLGRA